MWGPRWGPPRGPLWGLLSQSCSMCHRVQVNDVRVVRLAPAFLLSLNTARVFLGLDVEHVLEDGLCKIMVVVGE